MYLNILDDVTVKFHGKNTDIINHIEKDYGIFEVKGDEIDEIDIDVQFVEEVSSEKDSVHIREPVAYDEQGVFFHPSGTWSVMRVDFDAIGNGTCQVTCDVGFNRYLLGKLFEHLIHFYLLDNGGALCHSTAFKYDGRVIICPAWRNVGKTNLLLSLLEDGAQYIADDLCVVRDDGTVNSLPKRLNLLHYNFTEYPHLLDETSQEFQGLWEFVQRARSGEFGLDEDEIQTLTSQARMRISPYEAFDQEPDLSRHPVNHFCLLRKVNSQNVPVSRTPINAEELVQRMYATMEFEMSYTLLGYRTHKAQFGRVNSFLEQAKESHLSIYRNAIAETKDLQKVYVPSQNQAKNVKREIESILND